MASAIGMKDLLEAGVHFGHQTRRWNPKMRPFIFTARNGIHILDLAQTVTRLQEAAAFAEEVAAEGHDILFVGTKKQAQDVVESEAQRCQMPYVINRWLGGTMTNFQTIRTRIAHMLDLEQREASGDFERLPKMEALRLRDQMIRLRRYVGGLRAMEGMPGALFVIDVPKEEIAVAEATRLKIPIIAVCDTNADPTRITHPIPSNDDSIRAIRLITGTIAGAAAVGLQRRQAASVDAAAVSEAEFAAGAPAS